MIKSPLRSPVSCKIENCESPKQGLGYCNRHYKQFKKHGRILTAEDISESMRQNNAKRIRVSGWSWSDEAKKKRSEDAKGRRTNTGRTHFMAGNKPWNSGKKHLKITGVRNANWKGDEVSYRNLHRWVVRQLGQPGDCANCDKTKLTRHQIHWANISHEYRREVDDWVRLCTKCHKAYDMNKLTLLKTGG